MKGPVNVMPGNSWTRPSLLPLSLVWALCALATPVQAGEATFDLRIVGGRVPENLRLIKVQQGDLIRLRWTADRPLALHLHGYDIEQPVTAGAVAEMVFSARSAGQFPLYVAIPDRRGGHTHEEPPLVTLEVQPR
jgi:hypothetical protein